MIAIRAFGYMLPRGADFTYFTALYLLESLHFPLLLEIEKLIWTVS